MRIVLPLAPATFLVSEEYNLLSYYTERGYANAYTIRDAINIHRFIHNLIQNGYYVYNIVRY